MGPQTWKYHTCLLTLRGVGSWVQQYSLQASLKFHLVILQMTELFCWRLSLARPYLPATLAWEPQDQLLHIRDKGLLQVRQEKQRGLCEEPGHNQHPCILPAIGVDTIIQAGISNISDGNFSSALRVGTSSTQYLSEQ